MMAGHLRFGFIMSLIFFVLQLFPVNSKIIEGVLETSKNWAFLSKFCFAKKGGRYEYKFEYPSTYNVQSLLAYHDANEKWKTAYTTNLMFDPAEVLYLYESPGGYGLITMRIISAVLLLYTGGYTLKKHPHNPIYVSFLIFYFYWSLIPDQVDDCL
uniref:GPR180-like N-terminal domain-containing protein n=1 Tax=Strigamia maritima TaxID=126957 RepID=T1J4F2_STRMM